MIRMGKFDETTDRTSVSVNCLVTVMVSVEPKDDYCPSHSFVKNIYCQFRWELAVPVPHRPSCICYEHESLYKSIR